MDEAVYRPDLSLAGKLRRRLVRLQHRRPAMGRLSRPMVSFAFDDAPATAVRVGGDILMRRGLRGTYFIAAGLAGQHSHLGRFADADEIRAAARDSHEIGCHTYSHLDCGRADAPAVAADTARNLDALAAWGLPRPTTFAYPYGDVSAPAKRMVGERFALSRGLHHGVLKTAADLNQAPAVGIEGSDGEAVARRWLGVAAAQTAWLILFTHGVEPEPTEFSAGTAGFTRLVDEAISAGFDIVTVAEGARRLTQAN
ncbi:MAG: polysaccharide deacetylase family protein [Caulobacteraceae bacterium]